MAQLQIQHDDLVATLQAQRNEAWDAAARAGAAAQWAGRRIDELQNELDQKDQTIANLTVHLAQISSAKTEGDQASET